MALIGVAALCGCDEPQSSNIKLSATVNHGDWVDVGNATYIVLMTIEGHEYIITARGCRTAYTIHAAHCPCHTNNLNRINNN
jgi:hypothetical protein